MASYFDSIPGHLASWIEAQPMFFVATAPSGDAGHVNLSPKGLDTFRIVDPGTVAYLDLVGSGAETIAHLRQNGRIVVMFCGFDQPRRILRIWGRGKSALPGRPAAFPPGRELSRDSGFPLHNQGRHPEGRHLLRGRRALDADDL